MVFNRKKFFGLILTSLTVFQVNATTINLQDGRDFNGEVKSYTNEKVVLDMNGLEMTIPTQDIKSINFSEKEIITEQTQVESKIGAGTIEAGSSVVVKISDGFNSRNHKTGQRFSGVLESNLIADDIIVAPKGSIVYGVLTEVKKAGRVAGSASLSFELTDILIAGTTHRIQTQTLSGEGDNTAKSTAGKTARGASIGGLVNGSSGAKNGAKVGVGASILSQGNDIEVPANALIDFTLTAPFSVS